MSAFDDFNSTAFAETSDILGTEEFTIPGLTGTFTGILNEFTAERSIDLGGKQGLYSATLVCDLDQFDDLDGPLERTLEGKRLTLSGRSYKIDRVAIDSLNATLGLANLK